jgi:hypothetical protein
MFDQIGRVAERVATSVSRRGFLGSMGRGATAAALGVAAVLASATTALGNGHGTCCYYSGCPTCQRTEVTCGGVNYCDIIIVQPGSSCPATYFGCPFSFSRKPNSGQGCDC